MANKKSTSSGKPAVKSTNAQPKKAASAQSKSFNQKPAPKNAAPQAAQRTVKKFYVAGVVVSNGAFLEARDGKLLGTVSNPQELNLYATKVAAYKRALTLAKGFKRAEHPSAFTSTFKLEV